MPNEHIGYRLFSIVGFACALLLLFVFLKTRYGSHRALLCSSLLLITPLFTLLYSSGSRFEWLPARLVHDGYRLERISWGYGSGAAYPVQAPQPREPSTAYSLPTSAAPPRNPTVKSAP